MTNLQLPGNPRYQAKILKEIFGYDNLYKTHTEVELAVLETLCDIGVVPEDEAELLTPELKQKVIDYITTDKVDKEEREHTKHDIRALVNLIKEVLPKDLHRWVHVPLTSNDVINTAQALQFTRAHKILKKEIRQLISTFANIVEREADTAQVGRTHGQHALPITVGFWLSTILNRIIQNARSMDYFAEHLHGKISGAVGAYNAQVALGIYNKGLAEDGGRSSACEAGRSNGRCDLAVKKNFEELVLSKLSITPAPISTQIAPPEPLAQYLFSASLMTATLAQFGRDSRHLMRSEIGELREEFIKGQVGSSTMAHKRNPISFENLEGMWIKNKSEFYKVLDTLISEHQRDLVGSSVARDYPIILVNLAQQLATLLRKSNEKTFVERITIDEDALQNNLQKSANAMMAEPLYLALQIAGYSGDAHDLVNHSAMPIMQESGGTLIDAVRKLAKTDKDLENAIKNIKKETIAILENPNSYTGLAKEKALAIVKDAKIYLND